eukprot:CAMPEP_0113302330 /NCGR_PEP_ID=MMETSP0010_2-20120614/3183_1 /TAXON_ID=216773 ORGANISM="Corethron hystrix, Strain 308" /NCGR_SAMPLE_ID=MMETSP0010_2 /ASSEMBLY_ACC=CAM_ASM_000155 /LENGTH=613 /DNA_ID=CAMNT_0000156093 /DNA_START=173 /DNA_END=2015 /DNA_ORIENTATION=- /assembly_acc=CAM_ASM_000155
MVFSTRQPLSELASTISTKTTEKVCELFTPDTRPKSLSEYARREKALQRAKVKEAIEKRILKITAADNRSDLIVAVEAACLKFDHFDKYSHDEEIDLGASEALFFQMENILSKKRTGNDAIIELIVSALEMVHRCTSPFIKISVKRVGKVRAFQIPCQLVEKYVNYKRNHAHAGTIVCLVAKLFTNYTKATGVMQRMAEDYDIILAMVHVLESNMDDWVKMEAVNVLAELAYSEETNSVMIHVDGFIDALTVCAYSSNTKIKEGSARAFLNLATAMENEKFGKRDDTIDVLFACLRENFNTTRKCAIGALGNISACEQNKIRLVNYRNGELVKILLFIISSDLSNDLRKDAIGVLSNLACSESASELCNHPEFLTTVAYYAANDKEEDIQRGSLKVLRRLSSYVDADKQSHPILIKALLKTLTGKNAVKHVIAAVRDQASKPKNRKSLANFPGLLDALGIISIDVEFARGNAIRSMLFISFLEDGSTFVASTTVLAALTAAASLTNMKDILTRFAAIKTLKKLALKEENRKVMEKNSSLILALKWAAKKAAKIVVITDTLTELLNASPDDMIDTLLDVIDGDKGKEIRDDDLAALANATLSTIIPDYDRLDQK